jgi:hypothetical protein
MAKVSVGKWGWVWEWDAEGVGYLGQIEGLIEAVLVLLRLLLRHDGMLKMEKRTRCEKSERGGTT